MIRNSHDVSEDKDSGNPLDYLFSSSLKSGVFLRNVIENALDVLVDATSTEKTYSGQSASDICRRLQQTEILPNKGTGVLRAIQDIGKPSVENALNVGSPFAMAHLHCPVAIPALAAEALISATNQSLDSWDQSPFATLLEDHVIDWLREVINAPSGASGCFSSGGSQSNMTALYLALERHAEIERKQFCIFASSLAHFSIQKSARILGLASDAIISIATDQCGAMNVHSLRKAIVQAKNEGRIPLAIFATAGTTDLGAIDPLVPLSHVAKVEGLWLHVDAAYGGGLLFTRHREKLNGIELADSVTLDFHKMLFQPISCGVLMVKTKDYFQPLASKAEYLNPMDAVFSDVPNLVERSMQTTRRGDALKLYITFRAIGRVGLNQLISKTLENAEAAAVYISTHPRFQLAVQPVLSTVVFRYSSASGPGLTPDDYKKIREMLFQDGVAAVATTVYNGQEHFKLTLLNPHTDIDVISKVVDLIAKYASELEEQVSLRLTA